MLLLLRLLEDRELAVSLLDGTLGIHELLAESFVLISLDHLGGGWNVVVLRALRKIRDFYHNILASGLVPLRHHFIIHGLVVFVDSVRVAERRVNLLLDDSFHAVGELVVQGIQKVFLRCDLLLR